MKFDFPRSPSIVTQVEVNETTNIITVRNYEKHPEYSAVKAELESQGWTLDPLEGDGFSLHCRDFDGMTLNLFAHQLKEALS